MSGWDGDYSYGILIQVNFLNLGERRQLVTYHLLRLQVNGGSAAERAGLQAGDAVIRVNNTDVFNLRHQEAQDAIRAAGAALELTVQR